VADRYVSLQGDDSDGTTWAKAYNTIQSACDDLVAVGGTIYIGTGKYSEEVTLVPTVGNKTFTITGVGNVLWTASSGYCLEISNQYSYINMSHITITGEDGATDGIYNHSLDVRNSNFQNVVFRDLSGDAYKVATDDLYRTRFDKCLFDKCGVGLWIQCADTRLGYLQLCSSTFQDCGIVLSTPNDIRYVFGSYKSGGYICDNAFIDCTTVLNHQGHTKAVFSQYVDSYSSNWDNNLYVGITNYGRFSDGDITTFAAWKTQIQDAGNKYDDRSSDSADSDQLCDVDNYLYYGRHGKEVVGVLGHTVGARGLGIGWSGNVNSDSWEDWIDDDDTVVADGGSTRFDFTSDEYLLKAGQSGSTLRSPVYDLGDTEDGAFGNYVARVALGATDDMVGNDAISTNQAIGGDDYLQKTLEYRSSNTSFAQTDASPSWTEVEITDHNEATIESSGRYLQIRLTFRDDWGA